MGDRYKVNPGDFAEYLQSVVKLNALEKMTQDLDKELTDSQNIMMEIKAIYDAVSVVQNDQTEPQNNVYSHEDLSNFLGAGVPNLLMSDMTADSMNVNIDEVIANLKTYVEKMQKDLTVATKSPKPKEFVKLDLEQYSQNLEQMKKHVSNIKLNKRVELNNRSVELEAKLTQLCDDVTKFTSMVQAKTVLSESSKYSEQNDNNALQYDNITSKLLSGINEVTYLLQNKN